MQRVVAGNLVFVAGQAVLDEQVQLVSPQFGPHARQVRRNVRRALETAGMRIEVTAPAVRSGTSDEHENGKRMPGQGRKP